jgi:hypothetical protein
MTADDILQEYDGKLNFATDAWTSPNHRAFMATTVHLEIRGKAACIPLDVVEVAKSHSGMTLAAKFARVLQEFGIDQKVSPVSGSQGIPTYIQTAAQHYVGQCFRQRHYDRGIG